MLSTFIIIYCVQLIVVISLLIGSTKSKSVKNLQTSDKTSVIIPFKNEINRILPLLNSINKSASKHKNTTLFSNFQFIFIDDNSSDDTYQFIIDNLDISFQIYRLNNTTGKKYAIKKGVELAIYKRILTLDADVRFDVDYVLHISKTECKGLTILPVEMFGKTLLQKLFSVEFWFLQRITFGLAGFKIYKLCNGANLLFTKSAYFQTLKIRNDESIASGDDMFLLKAVNELQLPIQASYKKELTVKTPSVISIKELLNQRVRWSSKSKSVYSFIAGFLVLSLNLIFCISVFLILQGNFYFFIPFSIKLLSELISIRDLSKSITVVLHQFYYPVYLIILVIKMMFDKNINWR